MVNELKSYVNERFEQVNAPRTKEIGLLKKEISRRLNKAAKYYYSQGASANEAFLLAQKTLKNVKAPIRATLSERRKKEQTHATVKVIVSLIAMICLIMSPFPIVTQMRFGFVFAMGLIAFGIVLFAYSSKSVPKQVDVEFICDKFEIGSVKTVKKKTERPQNKSAVKRSVPKQTVQQRYVSDEEDTEGFDEYNGRSVYGTTSKMITFVFIGLYVIAGMLSSKWAVCLMIFPICFSVTRLAKAFTDFFRGNEQDDDLPPKRKGASK